MRPARPADCLRSHGESQSLQYGEGAQRLPRARSSEAERRGTEFAMRPGPRGVCCGSPAPAQPVGRRPQAGRLYGEPAEWRPAAVWSSSGERRHGAASGAWLRARGWCAAGRSWRRGSVGAGVARLGLCWLLSKGCDGITLALAVAAIIKQRECFIASRACA
jgi:hypothetical protein